MICVGDSVLISNSSKKNAGEVGVITGYCPSPHVVHVRTPDGRNKIFKISLLSREMSLSEDEVLIDFAWATKDLFAAEKYDSAIYGKWVSVAQRIINLGLLLDGREMFWQLYPYN